MDAEVRNEHNDKVDKQQVVSAFKRLFMASRDGKSLKGVREGPPPPVDGLPDDTFIEGWTAERVLRHLIGKDASPHEVTQLGPYIEAAREKREHQDDVLKLGEKQHVVAFPESLVILFASLDQDRIDTLGRLADWNLETVQTLHALAQREIERLLKRQMWARAWKATGAGAALAFVVAKWGWEVWQWVSTSFPSLVTEVSSWLLGLLK